MANNRAIQTPVGVAHVIDNSTRSRILPGTFLDGAPLLTLSAKASVQVRGKNSAVGAAAVKAKSMPAAMARAAFSGRVLLATRTAGISVSRTAISVAIVLRLIANSATRVAGRAASIGVKSLAALARTGARGLASPSGAVGLGTRASALSTGIAGLARLAGLAVRSFGVGQASAPIQGALTLTTNSSAHGAGMAHSSAIAGLLAVTAFGRSIANGFGLLVLNRALLVDPAYVVQYPDVVRMVSYPRQ